MAALVQGWMGTHARDGISFDDLFLREYARVVAIAQRVLGDVHEAEDVAQEIFCSFYVSHPPDVPYAAPWLYRAATHNALNVIRGRRRRLRRETNEATQQARLTMVGEQRLDPHFAAERSEERQEVRAALARLPEKSAAVLVLRYSGLSYAEVATTLDVGTGQIGTMLRRAEAALKKEMTRETHR